MATRELTDESTVQSIRIGPEHPHYAAVLNKRFNKRFSARPDYVRYVASTDHVLTAVQEAVNDRQRLVVTSGGHCLEGFVSDPDVRVILDISPMKRIYYDPEHRAIAVEAGATVGDTFRALFEQWGTDLFGMPPGGVCVKVKDALLRKRLTDDQIGVAYGYLTRTDHDVIGGMFGLATYGGRVDIVAPDATASAHRHAIFDLACTTGWVDGTQEAQNLAWVRAFYRDLFATTGGAPVPGEAYDGALINHPDVDQADPTLNRSGVPWHTLYYQANYPRLQRIKAQWDPLNVFRHALSIRTDG